MLITKQVTIPVYRKNNQDEWDGQRPSHWNGSKRIFNSEIREIHLNNNKRHFNSKFNKGSDPETLIEKKHYPIINQESDKCKFSLQQEKKHFTIIKGTERSERIKKVFPEVLYRKSEFYDKSNYNAFSPTKNQLVSIDFLSQRNSLPSLKEIKKEHKGFGLNLYSIHDNITSKQINKDPNFYLSKNKDKTRWKLKVESLEQRRNIINCNSPGDKNYKSVEFSKNYFIKDNKNLNPNFYDSVILPNQKKQSKLNLAKQEEKVYVENLESWEKMYLSPYFPQYLND